MHAANINIQVHFLICRQLRTKKYDKASKYINDGSTQIVAANNSILLAELVVQKYSINFTDKNIKQQIQDQKGKNISSMCLVC
jgi:hypothetical protein